MRPVQPAPGLAGRGRRKRPPWQAYIPFFSACVGCVLVLALIVFGVTHLVARGGHVAAPAPTRTPTSTAIVAATPVPRGTIEMSTPAHGVTATATSDVLVSALPHPDATRGISPSRSGGLRVAPVTTGGPHPTAVLRATARPAGSATLVVARELDGRGMPRKVARRFLSPALFLYAVATVQHVHRTDVLRFLFERDGKRMRNNDITFTARVDAAVHRFSVFADANDQETVPLSRGSYRVLFFRNGRLEAVTFFRVG